MAKKVKPQKSPARKSLERAFFHDRDFMGRISERDCGLMFLWDFAFDYALQSVPEKELVAFLDSEINGYIDDYYMENNFVDEGVAVEGEEVDPTRDFCVKSLLTTLEVNKQSRCIKVLERLGFKTVQIWRGMNDNMVMMVKVLPPFRMESK